MPYLQFRPTDGDITHVSQDSWGSNDYIIAGLSGVLGLLIILAIGCLVVHRCKHGAHADETQARAQPTPTSMPVPVASSATTRPEATGGTIGPAVLR